MSLTTADPHLYEEFGVDGPDVLCLDILRGAGGRSPRERRLRLKRSGSSLISLPSTVRIDALSSESPPSTSFL